MKKNKLLNSIRKNRSKSTGVFVEHSFDIVDRIFEILKSKEMDQKQLATALGKHESEVSKWLTGTHNFTLKTISNIESILERKIITVGENEDDSLENQTLFKYNFLYSIEKNKNTLISSENEIPNIKYIEGNLGIMGLA
jgi:transcriptional regulator with XRE-family HTH domain